MPEISYSGAAIKDLEQIGDYIAEQFKNLGGALNTVNKIQDRINTLNDFPLIGAPLSSIHQVFRLANNDVIFFFFKFDDVSVVKAELVPNIVRDSNLSLTCYF